MCGIVGILNFDRSLIDQDSLWEMMDEMNHRGPDHGGIYLSPSYSFAMGSRRLAIIDLSSDGNMPMANETEEIWVASNGELYNFMQLREILSKSGHRFKSRTDTEVILHAYEEYDVNFLDEIEGMFAIALWDDKKHRLILARDRVGKKPLYYSCFDRTFVFASEIKSFIWKFGFERKVDLRSLMEYLTYGFVMPPRTMFTGIFKLAPGEMVIVSENGKLNVKQYWSAFQDKNKVFEIQNRAVDSHVKEIRKMLEKSVLERLVADVPVGAFLSGGIDSSCVVAIMAKIWGHPVETVTVSYPKNPESDESYFAKLLATTVGAKYHQVSITEDQAINILSESVYHLDEPISDPACINTYYASEYFRKNGIIVSLVGEGADELFLGYPTYLRYKKLVLFWRVNQKLPKYIKQIEYRIIAAILSILGRNVYLDLIRRAVENETMFLSTWTIFPDVDKWPLLNSQIKNKSSQWPAHIVAGQVQNELPNMLFKDPLSAMSFTDFRMQLAEKFLMRVDKMSMAHSIEVRAPFLDYQIVQYALSIPGKIRALNNQGKYLLRLAVSDLIPEEIIRRPKMGFSTPVISWFKNNLGLYLEHKMESSGIFRDGIISFDHCKRLLKEHRRGISLNHDKLWNILILAEWYDQFKVTGYNDNFA